MGIATAILGAAAIGGATSVMGSNKQAKAAKNAQDVQWQMFQQNREDLLPWLEEGTKAVRGLTDMIAKGPGDFQADPGYQFRYNEGKKALRSLAAREGTMNSSAYDRGLLRYGQDYASNEYGNFVNRWLNTKVAPTQSLAGLGQSTGNSLANLGQNTAGAMGQLGMQGATAKASGYMGAANALGGGLEQYMLGKGLGLFGGGGGGATSGIDPSTGLYPYNRG